MLHSKIVAYRVVVPQALAGIVLHVYQDTILAGFKEQVLIVKVCSSKYLTDIKNVLQFLTVLI